jgi:hypothetical protein
LNAERFTELTALAFVEVADYLFSFKVKIVLLLGISNFLLLYFRNIWLKREAFIFNNERIVFD